MSYCRMADEIWYIDDEILLDSIEEIERGLSLDEIILAFRNGMVYDFIDDENIDGGRKAELMDAV